MGLPNIYMKTGWLGGIILCTVVGSLNIYTMQLLLQVSEYTGSRSYSSLGALILGKKGKILDFGLWFISLTNCVAYIFFIGEQVDYVVC